MTILFRFRTPIRKALVVTPFRLAEEIFYSLAQRALISLEAQHVIRALVHDRLRNVLLTARVV